MSFRDRFLTEAETEASITNAVDNMTRNYKAAPGINVSSPEPKSINMDTTLLTQGIANKDVNPTVNDLEKEQHRVNRYSMIHKNNSRIPGGANANTGPTSSTNQTSSLNEVTNPLTHKLQSIGINTGITDVSLKNNEEDIKNNAHKSGTKNITTGTKTALTKGKRDASRQAHDGLKSGSGVNEINRGTTLESAFLKIDKLIEEYTDMDVKWGTHAPGSKVKTVIMKKGVQPVNHTRVAQKMNDDMQNIIKAKTGVKDNIRQATMPKYNDDPAMKKTGGIHLQQSSIVKSWKDKEVAVKEAREQRISQQQQEKEARKNG
jgi:hypothetical protein